MVVCRICFFFSSRRRHTRFDCDWSSDVCSSDLLSVVVFLVFPPTRLQNELIPDDDRGFFLVVVRGPEGASLPYTDGYVRQVEQIIGRTPDGNGYFTIVGRFAGGVNSAFIGVILKDFGERHTTVQHMIGGLFPQLMGISGVLAFPYAPGAIGFSQPIQYVVQNPDFAKLRSEEHTSELQSQSNIVCRLLLEK